MGESDQAICKISFVANGSQKLTFVEQTLEHGKFAQNPMSVITSTSQSELQLLFTATGRDSAAYGTKGTVVYEATDQTQFTIYFDCPYGGNDPKSDNYIAVNTNTGAWDIGQNYYNYDKNHSHHTVEVHYYINEIEEE